MPPISPLFCGSTVSATYKGHNTTELATPKMEIVSRSDSQACNDNSVPKPNMARTMSINTNEGETARTIAAIILITAIIKIAY